MIECDWSSDVCSSDIVKVNSKTQEAGVYQPAYHGLYPKLGLVFSA
jgi:hypothetical protein